MRTVLALVCCAAVVTACAPSASPSSAPPGEPQPARTAVAVGSGGAVVSVNPYSTQVGLDVLKAGGNAVDAAVATAAALGVVEPYSDGIGGGGYFVYYDARARQVRTLDGRETAPAAMKADSFLDPATGAKLPFDDAVNSGLSVGVPGTPATWDRALRNWGTISLGTALDPAIRLAEQGFVVSQQFRDETAMNEQRFRAVTPTAELFLPGGQLPVVGSRFRNPDLAATFRLLARDGVSALYRGELAGDIVRTAGQPPVAPDAGRVFRPGLMQPADLAGYAVVERDPTHSSYRGVDLYGMAPSASGTTTVGEALNILGNYQLSSADRVSALHHYLEASRIAFADRNRWIGDPAFSAVPTAALLAPEFGKDRACLISPVGTLTSPVAPGDPTHPVAGCTTGAGANPPHEGPSTTHLVTADRWGNLVSYTLTIEQTGGSAITVPHRGFLLNNELTDFDFAPVAPGVPDPNLPGGGKRPRSSMSPSILLRDGKPFLVIGSPGGATIITTVLQTLVNRLDLGMSLPDAVAAPRASQRNAANTEAEPAFLDLPERAQLERLGQHFVLAPRAFTPAPEIGAVTALEFQADGRIQAVAEPTR
ncbi:MAG TPA: gamma-glutamyltransferase, partial [Pseudonocardia sp.]|nr:gamma-glutamyltransferase [Pseudonocardia sp.]